MLNLSWCYGVLVEVAYSSSSRGSGLGVVVVEAQGAILWVVVVQVSTAYILHCWQKCWPSWKTFILQGFYILVWYMVIFTDYLSYVNYIRGDDIESIAEVGVWVLDIKSCFSTFSFVEIQHISRFADSAPHLVAKCGSSKESCSWVWSFPSWLEFAVQRMFLLKNWQK